MAAIYLFFRNGESIALGCPQSEGLAAYNAIMEDAGGFVDLNNGDANFRVGIRSADVAAVCYNPLDNETAFVASNINELQLQALELSQGAPPETTGPEAPATT